MDSARNQQTEDQILLALVRLHVWIQTLSVSAALDHDLAAALGSRHRSFQHDSQNDLRSISLMTESQNWLPTPAMAKALGISADHFRKAWANPKNGGFLSDDLFKKGPHFNSTKYWNREAVFAAAREQGYLLPVDLLGE
jgi:hypothetical protein